MTNLFFYLLLIFAPTQLARHFFFDFSYISGIPSDYLAPTVYLTDIIIVLIAGSYLWTKRGYKNILNSNIKKSSRGARFSTGSNTKLYSSSDERSEESRSFTIRNWQFGILFLAICYLLFNSIFIASNKWVAIYKLVKIVEFSILGYVIYSIKPKFKTVVLSFSVAVFYSSILAVWQFISQKSIGSAFWFLGERTFNASTPGIAAFSPPAGGLLLRPYATFPHPNVLGGFLAVILPLILLLYSSSDPDVTSGESRDLPRTNVRGSWSAPTIIRIWLIISLIIGLTALILSFSKLAWFVTFVGFLLVFLYKKYNFLRTAKTKKTLVLSGFYILLLLSIIVPLILPSSLWTNQQYWQERVDLIKIALSIISSNWLFGLGLNNFITQSRNYIEMYQGLYIFQPVHNIFLLIFAESGIIGFILSLWFFLKMFSKILHSNIFFITVSQLFLLGLFDHYLITLQQGQILLTLFAALSFGRKMAY